MKENDKEALFELVRDVPTELSKERVVEIIGTLPSLPPPSGNAWFNHINLNSIIMTTTTVAIIASAVIYLSSPKTALPVPGQDPVAPVEIDSPVPAAKPIKADDSIEAIKIIPEPATTLLETDEGPQKKQEAPSQEAETAPAQVVAQTIDAVPVPDSIRPPENTQKPAMPKSVSDPSNVSTSEAAAPVKEVTPTTTPLVIDNGTESTTEVRGLDDLRLKRLKRTLLRELTRDRLIKTKRSLNVLHFKEGEIFVNNWRLNYEEFTKYSELLFKFRIKPGPEKRVVTDTKYVMVGDFTDRGFNGAAQGRAMDLKFVNDAVILRGALNDTGVESDVQQAVIVLESPKDQDEPGDIYIKTEGKVKDAEVNMSLLERMTRTDSSESLMGNDNPGVETFKNATTVFEKGNEGNTIEISTHQIKSFKKELYKYLVSDGLVQSRSTPVIMTIGLTPFKVNDYDPMTGLMLGAYERLLDKYDLDRAPHRKVLMTKEFIMIGDFKDGQFTGTVQGSLKHDQLQGTLLEEELIRYKIFNPKHHIESGNGMNVILAADKETASEERKIAPFDRLEVSGLAVVYLKHAPHEDVRVEVSGIELNDIKTESKDGLLKVYTTVNQVNGESISVHVTSPNVHSILVDGAAEVFSTGTYKADILKLISQGAGSIEMAVDAYRLHLQMDGGDIHLEGKAEMEKVDLLAKSDRGTLDQSGLNVLQRWTHEGGSTWSEQDLPDFRRALLSKLIEQGYISTMNNPASIRFYSDGMTVNDHEVAPNYVEEYRSLYRKYGLPANRKSRLWVDPDFMIIANRDGKIFELEIMGTELELAIEGSWSELEEAVLHRQ